MSKYETGIHKGQEILNEAEAGIRWTCWMNDINVTVDFDKDWNPTDKFSVTERLRGNASHTWVSGVSFKVATELAERLVVGHDYTPQSRSEPAKNADGEYSVGYVLKSDMHMHRLNDPILSLMYSYDDSSRMEWQSTNWPGFMDGIQVQPNKIAIVVAIDEESDIPEKFMIAYQYDHRYFTAILRHKGDGVS